MSIRIRVYPDPNSVGARRVRAQKLAQHRLVLQQRQFQAVHQQRAVQQQAQMQYGGMQTGYGNMWGPPQATPYPPQMGPYPVQWGRPPVTSHWGHHPVAPRWGGAVRGAMYGTAAILHQLEARHGRHEVRHAARHAARHHGQPPQYAQHVPRQYAGYGAGLVLPPAWGPHQAPFQASPLQAAPLAAPSFLANLGSSFGGMFG